MGRSVSGNWPKILGPLIATYPASISQGRKIPSWLPKSRVDSFIRVITESAKREALHRSKNILYCISLRFLVLPEIQFLQNYDAQPHGQRMRWLLGEYGACSSPDVTISQRWWPLVGQRGHPVASLGGTGLPEPSLQRGGHAQHWSEAADTSSQLSFCSDNIIKIILSCNIHGWRLHIIYWFSLLKA